MKAILQRYKSTVPYSQNLNNWLIEWAQDKNIWLTEVDDFDESDIEGTFKRQRYTFLQNGILNVWTGASENTIY